MKVAIPGGTGMIGTALAAALRARGDEVVILTRQEPRTEGQIQWDPGRGIPQPRRLEGTDAVVNLIGEPLATRPWTKARKVLLRSSRIDGTESLTRSLEKLDSPPRIFLGTCALGRFGDRGEGWIDDDDTPSHGFLAELAVDWEHAHLAAASSLGARGAVLRMGMAFGSSGGIFPHLVSPFSHGFGGWLGDGRQYTPWISLRDAVSAILHLLDTPSARGGFNGNVPDPVPNRAWAEALGRACGSEVRNQAPRWALRGAFGELADSLLLASVRARPRKLVSSGFTFEDTDAEALFRRLLAEVGR